MTYNLLQMKTISVQRAVNSIVWISCGAIVIGARAALSPSISTLAWEIIGGGMIVFGTARLLWAIIKPRRSDTVLS